MTYMLQISCDSSFDFLAAIFPNVWYRFPCFRGFKGEFQWVLLLSYKWLPNLNFCFADSRVGLFLLNLKLDRLNLILVMCCCSFFFMWCLKLSCEPEITPSTEIVGLLQALFPVLDYWGLYLRISLQHPATHIIHGCIWTLCCIVYVSCMCIQNSIVSIQMDEHLRNRLRTD